MRDRKPTRDDLTRLFRDVVLVLGGVFAMEGTDDRTISRVATGLERVYERACRKGREPRANAAMVPHPAIVAHGIVRVGIPKAGLRKGALAAAAGFACSRWAPLAAVSAGADSAWPNAGPRARLRLTEHAVWADLARPWLRLRPSGPPSRAPGPDGA